MENPNNELLFKKIDDMFKDIEKNIQIIRNSQNNICTDLYRIESACERLEAYKIKFEAIRKDNA